MASKVQQVQVEVEVQQDHWDFQVQRVWQSVSPFCFFSSSASHHHACFECGQRIHFVEACLVFGLIQGDAGKLGEAGSSGPPGQRVSKIISTDLLPLALDNKKLSGYRTGL